MPVGTALAIYFLIWWVVLFAVLPWGVRNQQEAGDVVLGTDPGAPAIHHLWRKLLWTTMVATIIFGILYLAYTHDLIPYNFLMKISGPTR